MLIGHSGTEGFIAAKPSQACKLSHPLLKRSLTARQRGVSIGEAPQELETTLDVSLSPFFNSWSASQ